ncbi:MAG: flagellar accessory protein FlaH, partial [Thermodesulfovibrionia bacterium]|nr:flagellar accessory protein FlaH [Thermodesulfovibrionia bacterium]
RIRSICDAHLHLKIEEAGNQLIKMIEVAKIRGAQKSTGNIISFDVDPGFGLRIIPISKAQV